MSDELILLINRDYGLDYSPRPHYEKVKVDSIDSELIAELTRSKFRVKYLSSTNYLLDVQFKGDSINKEQIQSLNKVANHITFLNLSDSALSEDLMPTLAEMPNLTRVNFSKNKLNSNMISVLIKHKYLESANLNTTDLTSTSLKKLLEESNLKRLYILDTKVTEDELSNLKGSYVDKEIISGFKFQPVLEAQSVFAQEKRNR
jgi:uncharacterized protein YjbI with pentapeptide repeats